jgi:hypothetical protein
MSKSRNPYNITGFKRVSNPVKSKRKSNRLREEIEYTLEEEEMLQNEMDNICADLYFDEQMTEDREEE